MPPAGPVLASTLLQEVPRRRRPWVLGVTAVVLAIAAGFAGHTVVSRHIGVLRPDAVLAVPGIRELSGLDWWPARGVLVTVTDANVIGEIRPDGSVAGQRTFAHRDFEDVAVDRSGQGLWVLDEGQSLIQHFDADLEPGEILPILPFGRPSINRGFEGLALAPGDGEFLVAAETHPPSWAVVRRDGTLAQPLRVVGAPSLSAIKASPDGTEVLLVSRERGLLIASASGDALTPWRPVAQDHVEGAAFAPGLGFVLCADLNVGRLLVFRGITDWAALKEACLGRR